MHRLLPPNIVGLVRSGKKSAVTPCCANFILLIWGDEKEERYGCGYKGEKEYRSKDNSYVPIFYSIRLITPLKGSLFFGKISGFFHSILSHKCGIIGGNVI